jgi:hypothetical protein
VAGFFRQSGAFLFIAGKSLTKTKGRLQGGLSASVNVARLERSHVGNHVFNLRLFQHVLERWH